MFIISGGNVLPMSILELVVEKMIVMHWQLDIFMIFTTLCKLTDWDVLLLQCFHDKYDAFIL